MPMRTLTRYGFMLFLLTVIAGCGTSKEAAKSTVVPPASNECDWQKKNCIFKGSYESGERKFAEQEARRLNKAQTIKLTSSTRVVTVVAR